MMKSEKTKRRKSLYWGIMSIVLGVLPLVIEKISPICGPGSIIYEYQDLSVLFLFASIAIGILAIITGCSTKYRIGTVLGSIGVGFSTLLFLGSLLFALSTFGSDRHPSLWQMETLSSVIQKYCAQNEGFLPDADTWCDQLLESVENVEEFSLETFSGSHGLSLDPDEKRSGFAFNKNLDECRISDINRQTVLLFEMDLGWNQNGTSATLPSEGHIGYWPFFEGGYPFGFIGPDSTFTVEFIKNSEIDSLNWMPAE